MFTTFFQSSLYKTFADYTDIEQLKLSGPDQYVGKEKIKSRNEDSCYEDKWFLLIRAGLYRAQVEKALSDIYQYFLGYSTDIEIIKKNDDYYVASRGIANYKSWFDCLRSMKINNGQLFIDDNGQEKLIVGLGTICALSEFFDDNDDAPGNFGLQFQVESKVVRAFKIDSEKSLDFSQNEKQDDSESDEPESLESEIKDSSIMFLKQDYTQTEQFKNEKEEILRKIATTDFTIIEKIIRKNITSTIYESFEWLTKQMGDVSISDDSEETEDSQDTKTEENLLDSNQIISENKEKWSIDYVINILQNQHLQLQEKYEIKLVNKN